MTGIKKSPEKIVVKQKEDKKELSSEVKKHKAHKNQDYVLY